MLDENELVIEGECSTGWRKGGQSEKEGVWLERRYCVRNYNSGICWGEVATGNVGGALSGERITPLVDQDGGTNVSQRIAAGRCCHFRPSKAEPARSEP